MRQTLEIDATNRTACVSAGYRLSDINQAAARHGLTFPIDLGAGPTIGGMVATNTGGARLVRYGGVRENLLDVGAVLARKPAQIVGGQRALRKNNTGLSWAQVLCGTFGAFGIITDATLKLHPLPRQTATALIATDSATDAISLQALIHFHPEAHEIGRVYRPELGFEANVATAASSLAALSPPENREWDGWTASARDAYLTYSALPAPDAQAYGVDLASAMRHARNVLPSDAIVTNGAGNYAVWLHRFFEYQQPRTELAPTCGAMGCGLPAAIAAALRHPERKVACVAGDGCFLMYPQELATASQYGAHLIVLVVNNGMYGTIRMHQENHYPKRISGTQLKGPDYVALAKSFGAYAERVSRTEDFAAPPRSAARMRMAAWRYWS